MSALKHSAKGFEGSCGKEESGPSPVLNYPPPNGDWRDLPFADMTEAQMQTVFDELVALAMLPEGPVN